MNWIKMDDKAPEHPKLANLSDAAFRTWHRSLAYCSSHLTDGHITRATIKGLGGRPRVITELTAILAPYSNPLLETTDSGFLMHDYLDYQPSREKALAERAAAAERKRSQRDRQRDSTPPRSRTRIDQELTNNPPEPQRATEDVSNPVDMWKLRDALARHAGEAVSEMQATYVLGKLLDRKGTRGRPVKDVTRWALAAIESDWPECVRWIRESGVA